MSAESSSQTPAVPSDGNRRVILQNQDGVRASISLEAAWRIRTPVDFGAGDATATKKDTRPDTQHQVVQLPATFSSNEASLQKVCEYLEHYKDPSSDRSTYDGSSDKTFLIDDWDERFIRVDRETFTSITCIAHFLGIADLQAVCCKITSRIPNGNMVRKPRAMFESSDDSPRKTSRCSSGGYIWFEDLFWAAVRNTLVHQRFVSREQYGQCGRAKCRQSV